MSKTTRGYYLPGVMRIRIDTEKPLNNLAEIDPDIQGAWYHEHIHFLQDVTTVSGVHALVKLLDRVKRAVEYVQHQSKEVQVPLTGVAGDELREIESFFSVQEGDLELFFHSLSAPKGSLNMDELIITNVTFHDDSRVANMIPPGKAQKVRLHLQDDKKRPMQYELGSIAIREQIAHYIDRKFYRAPTNAKFPYRICEDVANYYCKGLGNQPRLLYALCEVSLSYMLPGWAFCKLLEAIKDEQFPFETAGIDGIISFGLRKFSEWGWDSEVAAESLIDEIQQLTSQLFQGEGFEPTIGWLQYIVKEGLGLRNQFPAMLTDLFVEKKVLNLSHGILIEKLGSPMAMNFNSELGMIIPSALSHNKGKVFPQILLVIYQLLKFFTTGDVPCKILQEPGRPPCDCVTMTGDLNIAIRCQGKPWKNVHQPMCPFATFWRLFHFDKVKFVDKKGLPLDPAGIN